MSNEDYTIKYVDGRPALNFCSVQDNLIIIDENLWDYPLAFDYIKSHELGHLERGDNLFSQIVYEFKNDLFIYFSTSDAAFELREYIEDNRNEILTDYVLDFLRTFWLVPLAFLGEFYLFFRGVLIEKR